MKHLSPQQAAAFRRKVYAYYRRHRRTFPWRTTRNPYKILVSEFMLQQTQTHRVVPMYRAFLKRFPSVRALAAASQKDVLRSWQGLGYNRRALNLHKTAKELVARYRGSVPRSYESRLDLPGIGPYTAAAIGAFAFNEPGIVLETNIRTVFIHEFFPRRKVIPDAALAPLIEQAMDQRSPGRWYSALMDYGVMLKTTQGNITRRSASYARQSAFKGSDRAVRGKIVKLLLEKPRRLNALTKLTNEPSMRVEKILQALAEEGFVEEREKYFSIS